MKKRIIRMSTFHTLLITRQLGKQIKERIIQSLEHEEMDVVILDFTGVQVLDFSWADECVAKLLAELNADLYHYKGILVENCTDDQAENIAAALLQRNLYLIRLESLRWQILGDLREPLFSTLNYLHQSKSVTARDVADYFQIAINTASNRLSELAKKHIVLRYEETLPNGGKQYVYQSLT